MYTGDGKLFAFDLALERAALRRGTRATYGRKMGREKSASRNWKNEIVITHGGSSASDKNPFSLAASFRATGEKNPGEFINRLFFDVRLNYNCFVTVHLVRGTYKHNRTIPVLECQERR